MIDRRNLLLHIGSTAVLLKTGLANRAFASPAGERLSELTLSLDMATSALRAEETSVAHWREAMADIFARIDLDDLLAGIDFDRLRQSTGYAERGVATAPLTMLTMLTNDGRRLSFYPKLFAVGRGRAIIPHGHENMVSAHLTLSGRFHVRQYDKLAVEDEALFIRPSIDRIATPGDLSSIAEERDNIHWFVAEEDSHTFDVVATGLDETAGPSFDIYNLHMNAATPAGNSALRAPRISVPDALRLYG